jgi:hypothetical protein
MQLHTLLGTKAVDMVYALHLHSLRIIGIEVLCCHEVETRSILFMYMRSIVLFVCGGVLFII